jgi:hypothetical protein
VVLPLPRPGAPWPAALAPCALATDAASTEDEHGIFRSAALDDELVHVQGQTYGGAMRGVLDALPVLGRGGSARYRLEAPLAVAGWTPLPRLAAIQRRVTVADGRIWMPRATLVRILGTTGGAVAVDAELPFVRPYRVEAAVDCAALSTHADPEPPAADADAPRLKLRSQMIDLYAAPRGARLFAFVPRDGSPPDGPTIVQMERRAGFVRIRASAGAGHCDRTFVSAVVEGWIREDDVERPLGPDDRDTGSCDVMDRMDRCDHPTEIVPRAAPVYTSDTGGAPVGIIQPGTQIDLDLARARANRFPFVFTDGQIGAAGRDFWIEAADVPHENGCPE